MVLGADNRKPWSRMDVLLAQAYQVIQDEKCPQHGGPRWACDSEEQSLRLRIKDDYCVVKAEVDEAEKSRASKDEPGIQLRPEFYSADGRPLAEYRDLYRKQKAREAAEEADPDD